MFFVEAGANVMGMVPVARQSGGGKLSGTSRTQGSAETRKLMDAFGTRRRWRARTLSDLLKKTNCGLVPAVAEPCLQALVRTERINFHRNPDRVAVYVK